MKYTNDHIIKVMEDTGLIPVFNHSDISIAKEVLDASYQAGIRVFEFTNRDTKALNVFIELRKYASKYDDLILGIGTIFTKTQSERFLNAGADFIVSPALIHEVADFCNKKEIVWIPGCATITEVYTAHRLGAQLIKAFPGNILGPNFIKAVKTVLPQVKIMPTGGVEPTLENLKLWFNSDVSCVGMGSQLFNKNDIKSKNFPKLTEDIKEALQHIQKIKNI
ncbi:bifunctional 4-hydroxy-2-oxoglutarate aldolase/2-dehydro-3-deoxy-phosphogluconate aldolase [Aquimarina sp. BL5]|uniref:bifunctional 4-hydroxy-2-oxoglutarate aldolase/2-dehydro-3-deoxy-phosphogluconate aldolase n=1 Tax=Aquimarina sp. BL5 TaxID=1714860 RepID=UPI000E4CEAE2|nr:bifunctional 4-hydroxy-2-oxoglutarate aldolase/2-dehydro-3-deoxy-phosphogluconate aldolase [Aquimarina sp. BL5]AXT51597.1 bifunctional 4-hydroxy-2-oxoglutarate aldolase/2-dehydro-3-deoxy-phosphogluconate aldolase [Aquimarina sp. BL5]RKN00826.1 bifunctional 4-hydroxy-2-oxoglutarate aldolase/2-dehydro-3-deoxy-phosphogluconate aldolase [Aquimarina sp. BL5]